MKLILLMPVLATLLASAAQAAPAPTTEQRYARTCGNCHEQGTFMAPRRGDKTAWAPRLRQGEDVLLAHTKNSYKMMPARGMCSDCTDAEFKALIRYMAR